MLNWIKKHWKKAMGFIVALWPALRIFIRWPMAAVSIATIPIQQFVQRQFNPGPVTSKIIGFAIFFALMVVSWHVAELIVALAALALMLEAFLLVSCIRKRFEEQEVSEVSEMA